MTNATAILLINDYCKRKALLETKLASTVEFKTTVDAAIEALKELKSSKIDLSARETATKLYKIGKDLDDKIEAFRKSIK